MSFRTRSILKLASLWIGGALAIGMIVSSTNLFRYRDLVSHGVATTGLVTSMEPANHQFVGYSYEIAGRVFSGKGGAGFGNPEFGLLHVGNKVSISYLPDNPYVSCLGDPRELLKNETISVLLATVFFPTFALVVLAARYVSFRRWLTN